MEKITPVLYNLFHKIQAEKILPNSLCEDIIILIPKPGKDITRKLHTNISHERRCKNFQQILATQIQQYIKSITQHNQVRFTPALQAWFNIQKSTNEIHHITHRLNKKNHMILTIDAKRAFDKIQYPFIIKTLSKRGRRELSQLHKEYL